jgi:hypothetical protein
VIQARVYEAKLIEPGSVELAAQQSPFLAKPDHFENRKIHRADVSYKLNLQTGPIAMTLEIVSRSVVMSLLIKAAGGATTRACARSLGLLELM